MRPHRPTGHDGGGSASVGSRIADEVIAACVPCDVGSADVLDLVVQDIAGKREGFEMKLGADPRPPRGFWNAVDDLDLHSVTVLHAGEGRWQLREGVEAHALVSLASA